MKWSTAEEEKLKKLYCQTNLPLEKIARIIGHSVPSLNSRLTKLKLKRRYPLKCKCPSKITPALSRIHAHLCGDGYVYSYRVKDIYGPWAKYRRNPFRMKYFVGYSNNNIGLLKEFQSDIRQVFKIKGKKIHKNEVKVVSKKIFEFMRKMGVADSYKWRIPKMISNNSEEVQKNWIRAFFDDEADFDEDGEGKVTRIRVKCVNKKGLIQLLKLLRKFIPCHLTPKRGFYWGKTVCLNIDKKDVSKFFSEIGSIRYPYRRRSSVVRADSS